METETRKNSSAFNLIKVNGINTKNKIDGDIILSKTEARLLEQSKVHEKKGELISSTHVRKRLGI